MIEILLLCIAIGAMLFYFGEQREGAIFSGMASVVAFFACLIFVIYLWVNMP